MSNAEAVIKGRQIIIKIAIKDLKAIIEGNPDWPEEFFVSDIGEAAKSLVYRLNDEEEDGTTRLHRAIDSAVLEALEQGDEGFDEREVEDY